MPKPEAFSRVLIDQALKDSGWDLLHDHRVRFELDGKSGRADYVLSGERGPLCVLEAKRPLNWPPSHEACQEIRMLT
jgi:predicted type IV restriction endonuclease